MLNAVMEPDVIKGLGPLADQYTHNKAVAYFEQIKASDQGLEFCATAISQGTYQEDYINFFLWQVLEHQIKARQLPENFKMAVRNTLLAWLQNYTKQGLHQLPGFVRNKAAQVFALAFSKEYLAGWCSFTQDVLLVALGENPTADNLSDRGVDLYLRILLAIDSEVVDRSIVHTEEEKVHNQLLKDTMRDRSINEMVDSWFCILTGDQISKSSTAMCLQVVGAYITWIDIGLIANDRFMSLILSDLGSGNALEIREAACDCVREISLKGMLPHDKLPLIETLWGALLSSGVLTLLNDDEEIDFVIKLSRLVASMASTLIASWNRIFKPTPDVVKKEEGLAVLASAINNKMSSCMTFFEHEDDDVSAQCIDFMRDYIDMQKRIQPFENTTKEILKELFRIILKKLKYDEEYRFTNEGEDEADFQEYLRSIKVIYDNLAILCPEIVINTVHDLLAATLPQWQTAAFNDVEVAIRALYMLGESLPSNMSFQFSTDKETTSPLHSMVALLVSSGVSNHSHSAVRLQFFETVARYDRYFPAASNIIEEREGVATTTQAFIDHRGLHSDDQKIRSRCAYLFSRFVKTVGKQLSQFVEEILNQIQDLLVLSPINGIERALCCEDQLFVYELAGNLIVNSTFAPERKAAFMTTLLRPLVEEFQALLVKMGELHAREENMPKSGKGIRQSELCANTLNYAMSYASRTSKAFSNKQTISQSGCSEVYTDALKVFLQALNTDVHRKILHTGVRQYLHRMVICLEDEVLPFVPITVRYLLSNQESQSLHDFIPLINQIVNKFKKLIEPFLHEVFMLVVRSVFTVLSHHNGTEANGTANEDSKIIRRSYFQFLHGLVTNGVANVILTQETADVEMILSTLIEGASDISDAIAQKICFTVLIRIIQAWGDNGISLRSFICKQVIPVCFMFPLNPKFEMNDAQAIIALNESASFIKAAAGCQGVDLESFLRQQYLPSIQLSPQIIEEYCHAMNSMDNKGFRAYIKAFFRRTRS